MENISSWQRTHYLILYSYVTNTSSFWRFSFYEHFRHPQKNHFECL